VGGSNTLRGLVARPVIARDNYYTSIPGVYLCSSSTPPGAGTHGMCGHLAARSALANVR
jgi:phytoene dehydrogenase-like protein